MLPLRYRKLWIVIGSLLICAVITMNVSSGVILSVLNPSWGDKVAHLITYCLLMVWFSGLYERRQQGRIALALFLLGLALELVQRLLPYRQFEAADLVANSLGLAAGFLLSVWMLAGWCQRMERRLGYHK